MKLVTVDGTTDIGVQIADYAAGVIADLKELRRLEKELKIPSNFTIEQNPSIDKETEKLLLTGHARLSMNPVSLIDIKSSWLFKVFGLSWIVNKFNNSTENEEMDYVSISNSPTGVTDQITVEAWVNIE